MGKIKEDLIAGYQAFQTEADKKLYSKLGRGQSPRVMVIGCADSRVDPLKIFNANPGDIFVTRNVANIVPPSNWGDKYDSTMAAIEYAVTVLKVEMLMVMGHASCGGVKGCLDGMGDRPDESHVSAWVSLLNRARDKVVSDKRCQDNQAFALELEGVRTSLENLMTFPFVKKAVDAGELKLQGAYFSIADAQLLLANEAGEFKAA